MVEQTNARERHRNAVFVTAVNDDVVTNRAAGLHNGANAAAARALNVVVKREECIRTQRNIVEPREPCFPHASAVRGGS